MHKTTYKLYAVVFGLMQFDSKLYAVLAAQLCGACDPAWNLALQIRKICLVIFFQCKFYITSLSTIITYDLFISSVNPCLN